MLLLEEPAFVGNPEYDATGVGSNGHLTLEGELGTGAGMDLLSPWGC